MDHTLYIKHSGDGKIAILIVYIDNIILIGSDEEKIARLKKSFSIGFEIKNLGSLQHFLGMVATKTKNWIFISQRKHVLGLLEETGMSRC